MTSKKAPQADFILDITAAVMTGITLIFGLLVILSSIYGLLYILYRIVLEVLF